MQPQGAHNIVEYEEKEFYRFERTFELRWKCLDEELPPLSMFYVNQKLFAECEIA